MAQSGALKRKLSSVDSSATEDDFDLDDEMVNLTDTEAAISLVIRSEKEEMLCKGALIHQLYAVLSNKTAVDVEILKLRQNKGIKLLNFNLAGAASATESQFIMMSRDYTADLNDMLHSTVAGGNLHGSLSRFIPLAMKYLDRVSILESDLLTSNTRVVHGFAVNQGTSKLLEALPSGVCDDQFSVEDIQNIVTAGFLSKRRDLESAKVLWFAHPILGNLRRWIDSSRKEIMVE